jgi:hypothetical protein
MVKCAVCPNEVVFLIRQWIDIEITDLVLNIRKAIGNCSLPCLVNGSRRNIDAHESSRYTKL